MNTKLKLYIQLIDIYLLVYLHINGLYLSPQQNKPKVQG